MDRATPIACGKYMQYNTFTHEVIMARRGRQTKILAYLVERKVWDLVHDIRAWLIGSKLIHIL